MIALLNILSIINLCALALLLGIRKHNTLANRLLGLSIFFSSTDFIINLLSYHGLLISVPYILFFNFSFLWSPFVMWYVYVMLEIKYKINAAKLVHAIPLLLSWCYWGYVFSQGDLYLDTVLKDRQAGEYTWQLQSFQFIIILQAIGYLGYSARLIFRNQNGVNGTKIPAVRLRWMKQFILILSGLIFLLIAFSLFLQPVTIDYVVAPILYDISNVFLVYKSFSASGIFADYGPNEENVPAVQKERYTGSTLKQDQKSNYKQQILECLKNQEPYTNPDLTLIDLSNLTDIQAHQLSQVINQEFGKNFFELINSYRIEKSKSLMQDPKTANLTLEAIGLK